MSINICKTLTCAVPVHAHGAKQCLIHQKQQKLKKDGTTWVAGSLQKYKSFLTFAIFWYRHTTGTYRVNMHMHNFKLTGTAISTTVLDRRTMQGLSIGDAAGFNIHSTAVTRPTNSGS